MSAELILVVEDDPEITTSLNEWLRLVGYQPQVAFNGKAALELLHRILPALIISDSNLPEAEAFFRAIDKGWLAVAVDAVGAGGEPAALLQIPAGLA